MRKKLNGREEEEKQEEKKKKIEENEEKRNSKNMAKWRHKKEGKCNE